MSKSEGLYPNIPTQEQGYHAPPPTVVTPVYAPPVAPIAYGPVPQLTTCPHCHQQTTTVIITEAAQKTHLVAFLLCLIGCIPCCLIPYCVDTCKNKNHYCSSCNAYLGAYH